MEMLILLLLFSKLLVTEADATRYIRGNISQIEWFPNSCTFQINEDKSPHSVRNYRLCKILEQTHIRDQGVVMEIEEIGSSYSYSVNYLDRTSTWSTGSDLGESSLYQLYGTVEDIYYHSSDDNCFIAIDTGFASAKNNKYFHPTMNWSICVKAINAFYSREKVIMSASVYTNSIVDLQVGKC